MGVRRPGCRPPRRLPDRPRRRRPGGRRHRASGANRAGAAAPVLTRPAPSSGPWGSRPPPPPTTRPGPCWPATWRSPSGRSWPTGAGRRRPTRRAAWTATGSCPSTPATSSCSSARPTAGSSRPTPPPSPPTGTPTTNCSACPSPTCATRPPSPRSATRWSRPTGAGSPSRPATGARTAPPSRSRSARAGPTWPASGSCSASSATSATGSGPRTPLRASEARFRALMEQAPFSVQLLGPDSRTLRVNRAWEELWGVTLRPIAGYVMLEDPQLEAKGVLPYLRRAFAGEPVSIPAILYDPNETIPDRARPPTRPGWVSAVAYPLRDPDGTVREVVLVHQDITERATGPRRRPGSWPTPGPTLAALVDPQSALQQVARLAVPALADWCVVDLAGADGRAAAGGRRPRRPGPRRPAPRAGPPPPAGRRPARGRARHPHRAVGVGPRGDRRHDRGRGPRPGPPGRPARAGDAVVPVRARC